MYFKELRQHWDAENEWRVMPGYWIRITWLLKNQVLPQLETLWRANKFCIHYYSKFMFPWLLVATGSVRPASSGPAAPPQLLLTPGHSILVQLADPFLHTTKSFHQPPKLRQRFPRKRPVRVVTSAPRSRGVANQFPGHSTDRVASSRWAYTMEPRKH